MNDLISRSIEFNNALINTSVTNHKSDSILLNDAIKESLNFIQSTISTKSNLYIIGNGGSAGIASHAANDFINMCDIKAITFHDISVLTCLTNDYGYENAFKILLEKFSKKNDVLISISSSGNSPNILNATKFFKKNHNAKVITLSGFNKSNKLRGLGDINFWIDSHSYGIVEIAHQFILHNFADQIYNQKK